MNQRQQEERVRRFINDRITAEAVFNTLLASYLKTPKDADVQVLAASMIAVEKLRAGWREMERLQTPEEKTPHQFAQVGM